MPANPNTAFTLQGGERKVIILENAPITTPTPTPPTTTPPNTPESTPTPTPTATPSPTPINTDEFEIDDVDPAFGPETGEGDFLFMIAAFLVVAGIALVAIKRKLILHK
jgi:LPXTG-motif cell wall-anchored protein